MAILNPTKTVYVVHLYAGDEWCGNRDATTKAEALRIGRAWKKEQRKRYVITPIRYQ